MIIQEGWRGKGTHVKNDGLLEFELLATLCTSTAIHSTSFLPSTPNSILSALLKFSMYALAPLCIARNGAAYSAVRPVTLIIREGVEGERR